MRDRTRRMLCRAGFLAVCVVPTLGVLAWSSSRTSAEHSADCAAALSRELGVRVWLAGVSYPRPGITLYDGVELADPETSTPLVRLRFLEAGGGENLTALVASQPELDALQLGRLWQIVQERMRRTAGPQPLVRLAASEVALHWPDGSDPSKELSQSLTAVLGQLDAKSGGDGERVASLSFRLVGAEAPEQIRIHYSRRFADIRTLAGSLANRSDPDRDAAHRLASEPANERIERETNRNAVSHVELDTGGAAIPCSLLTIPLGIANRLGEQARFCGAVWATETADGWEGELTGRFTQLDLQTIVTEQFPHHLTGTAAITITKARFRRGRLEEASGTLTAGPGVVGQSLLTAAAENLHLSCAGALDPSPTLVPYEQLAVAFEIDSSGLVLRGQCDGSPGAILRGGTATMLAESGGSLQPVVALLRTLVPQSEVQVPATRESDWLMQRLPVPQVMLPPNQPPQGKLRLAPERRG